MLLMNHYTQYHLISTTHISTSTALFEKLRTTSTKLSGNKDQTFFEQVAKVGGAYKIILRYICP